jgi:hypothetical protein
MPRILRLTLIGFGGLAVLVVLIGMVAACGTEPSSPPEREEQDEGVEGGGKQPEATRSLYQQAELEKTPPYEITFTTSDTNQRYDVYVHTEPTRDKAKLGAILIELEARSGSDLVYANFCEKSEKSEDVEMPTDCANSVFTDGMLAATDRGVKSMEGSGVQASGEPPVVAIPASP